MIRSLKDFNRNKIVKLKIISADPLIKLKKYSDSNTGLGPGLDRNGFPDTGLSENYTDEEGKIVIGTREQLESELDLAPGSLKKNSNFWASYSIPIGSEPMELNLNDGHDLLKYLVAVHQTIVANGIKDIENKSNAEFVLFSQEQEAETRVNARKLLKKAYALSDKLDIETKVNILSVYGYITDATNVNTIDDKIDEKIESDPGKFLKIVDDDFLIFRSLVTKCLDKGILTAQDGSIYHGEVSVGYDKETAARAIAKNNNLQTILKAKLSGDMDLIQKALIGESKKEAAPKVPAPAKK